MTKFANLADAGVRLAELVRSELDRDGDLIVLAAIPNGVPVALPVASALGVHVIGMPVDRTPDGPVIGELPDVAGHTVLVIDDGVETGSVAFAAARAISPLQPSALVLAVPVCSREAMANLQHQYTQIIAVDRPLGRRALAWHFDDFDTIDEAKATALLDAQR